MVKHYLIGEVEKIIKISQKTIRYLSKIGIVTPFRSSEKSFRYYSEEDVNVLLSLKIENFEGEIIQVQNFPNYYVDSNGDVYDYSRNFLYKLKQYKSVHGYMYIRLHNEQNNKHFRVHRLVAELFIENDYNKEYVNHKNGNKTDNRVSNLEWCTAQENSIHAYDNNLAKNKKGFEDSQSIHVNCYDENMNLLKQYGSISEASRELGLSKSTIARRIKNNSLKPFNKMIFTKNCSATTIPIGGEIPQQE